MKQLDITFVRTISGDPNQTLTQIRRNENFAIYKRESSGKFNSYEVIRISIKKAGTYPLPGGKTITYTEDQEEYATTSMWGKNGWSTTSLERANDIFDRLTAGRSLHDDPEIGKLSSEEVVEVLSVKPERKSGELPVIQIPSGEFTMLDIAVLNNMERTRIYPTVRQYVELGKIKELRRESRGKGKPTVIFGAVN